MKNNIIKIIYILVTVILAGVAIFIAVRLYQLKSEPVAPTAPQSQPGAEAPPTQSCEAITLNLTLTSPSPEATATTTATATATASPTATPTSGATASPSISSPTASPTQVAAGTPLETLPPDVPVTGVSLPAILGVGLGILLIIGAVALVL